MSRAAINNESRGNRRVFEGGLDACFALLAAESVHAMNAGWQ